MSTWERGDWFTNTLSKKCYFLTTIFLCVHSRAGLLRGFLSHICKIFKIFLIVLVNFDCEKLNLMKSLKNFVPSLLFCHRIHGKLYLFFCHLFASSNFFCLLFSNGSTQAGLFLQFFFVTQRSERLHLSSSSVFFVSTSMSLGVLSGVIKH